jgi:hypothetical protein
MRCPCGLGVVSGSGGDEVRRLSPLLRLPRSATKRDKAGWVLLPEWLMEAIETTCPHEDRVPERRVFQGITEASAYQAMLRGLICRGSRVVLPRKEFERFDESIVRREPAERDEQAHPALSSQLRVANPEHRRQELRVGSGMQRLLEPCQGRLICRCGRRLHLLSFYDTHKLDSSGGFSRGHRGVCLSGDVAGLPERKGAALLAARPPPPRITVWHQSGVVARETRRARWPRARLDEPRRLQPCDAARRDLGRKLRAGPRAASRRPFHRARVTRRRRIR